MSDDSDSESRERTAFEHLVDAARTATEAAFWKATAASLTGDAEFTVALRRCADDMAKSAARDATFSACAAALVLVTDLASLGGSAVDREAHADDLDEADPAAGAVERSRVVGVDVRAGTADHDLDAGGHPPDGSAVPSPARGEEAEGGVVVNVYPGGYIDGEGAAAAWRGLHEEMWRARAEAERRRLREADNG